ncbi:MAG TPA: TOBE domain-containing protein, partial [Sphingomicrobium sp.]
MTLAHRIVLLNNQRIEQIGTPIDIYMRPASEFVASFVGTPKINILPVHVQSAEGGTLRIALGDGFGFDARLEDGSTCATGATRLGIRAEEVSVAPAAKDNVRGRVEIVERLGDRTLVHARLDDGSLMVAEDAGCSTVERGDVVGLSIASARIHLFNDEGRASHAKVVRTGAIDG